MGMSLIESVFEHLSIGIAIVDDSCQIIQRNKLFGIHFNYTDKLSSQKLDQFHL